MVPRRIHYCWLSKDPYPEIVRRCIESWHLFMPEWEYVLWDLEKIKDIKCVWLDECIKAKKWAFAADFIRVWAVFHEGGIYLDTDVEVFRSFEPLLIHHLFIGRENLAYKPFDEQEQIFLSSHCFGAEANHPFLKINLSYYKNRHFCSCEDEEVPNVLKYDMLMMPYIQSKLAEKFGYDPSVISPQRQSLKAGIEVFPSHYFCAGAYSYNESDIENYARHHGQGSWREPDYWEMHQDKPVTTAYKIRWRFVKLLDYIAEKLDYRLVRIHPDGRI